MDSPLAMIFGMFCLAPLLIFSFGVWVGRGAPGLPFRVHFERTEERPAAGGRRVAAQDWQP